MMFQTFLSSYRQHAGRQSSFPTASSSLAWTHNLVAEARLGMEGRCRADARDENLQQLDTPPGENLRLTLTGVVQPDVQAQTNKTDHACLKNGCGDQRTHMEFTPLLPGLQYERQVQEVSAACKGMMHTCTAIKRLESAS